MYPHLGKEEADVGRGDLQKAVLAGGVDSPLPVCPFWWYFIEKRLPGEEGALVWDFRAGQKRGGKR